MTNPSLLAEWKQLKELASTTCLSSHEFSLNQPNQLSTLKVDYSRQLISQEAMKLLRQLAYKRNINQFIHHIFNWERVNSSEQCAAAHTIFRSPKLFAQNNQIPKIKEQTQDCLQKMRLLSDKIRSQSYLSADKKPIKNIINIGGSDLGPKMVVQALKNLAHPRLNFYFVSNLDPADIHSTLANLCPSETLFIVSSKSFNTLETITNLQVAKTWLGNNQRIQTQCFAVTTNQSAAIAQGIKLEHIFPLWNFIGGRYSLWSAIGLPIALAIGFENFQALLKGGAQIDNHINQVELEANLPLTLALIDIWNINFLQTHSHAIIPYSFQLNEFVPYIQQLVMESNGKSINSDNQIIDYQTAQPIWGGVGSNSQHSFHQLLMQGTQTIPVEFIYVKEPGIASMHEQHKKLIKQVYAQSDALWFGNKNTETDQTKWILGRKPHTVISLNKLTPQSLGELIALYEYKTLFQACIWGINPFDQNGVELGKKLALKMEVAVH